MKYFVLVGIIGIILAFSSCSHSEAKEYSALKNRLDSLETTPTRPVLESL